ncbi:UNVERIFIED_CONTAM: hypothetical protein HDU68_000626 [Siphonaria sp. JEL0065]|nr:hypothetical protein HDU68_000626 [Siphonaria sp. JEL0065]
MLEKIVNRQQPTGIWSLPKEILCEVMIWIRPIEVIRAHQVSRQFRSLPDTLSFVKTNLMMFKNDEDSWIPYTSPNATKDHRIQDKYVTGKDWRVVFLFKAPSNYQLVFARELFSLKSHLEWDNVEEQYLNGCGACVMLNAVIPPAISYMTCLTNLCLSGVLLKGSLPNELFSLTRLIYLIISHNKGLIGQLPSAINNLAHLKLLCLNDTNIGGPLPGELWDLVNLRVLDLCRNQFSGELSPLVGRMEELVKLDLSGNSLSGVIPREVFGCGKLLYLQLHGNGFEEPYPVEMGLFVGPDGIRQLRGS